MLEQGATQRCLAHRYEQGGIGHFYLVALFRLKSPDLAVGLWSGYRGPAKNLQEMKQLVSEDESCCKQ
jgi:hypothetical protein